MLNRLTAAIEKRPLWLLLPIALLPVLPEYLAPVLALAVFSLACLETRRRGESIKVGRVGQAVLAYMAWMSIGVFYSSHPLNTLSTLAMWAVMFALYIGVITIVTTKERLEQLLFLIAIAVGVVGFIATVQYVLVMVFGAELSPYFWDPVDTLFYRYFPMELDFVVPGPFRTAGTFNNPNIMAEYLIMAMPFAAYYAFSRGRTTKKLIARVAVLCGITGIAVSLCRGAYLALIAMCAVVAVFRSKRMSALMLAGGAALSVVPESVFNRFLSIGSGDKSIAHRLQMWQEALIKVADRPLFGYGAGVSNTTDMLLAINLDAPHMHNVFLQVLIEGGFPALILLGTIAFCTLRHSMDMHIRGKGRGFGVTLIAFCVGAAVCGMFDFLFMTPKLVGFFLVALGLADSGARVLAGQPISLLVPKEAIGHDLTLVPAGR